MMLIANPIYDIVYKYLLEDNKIAKLIISNLIELEIEELEFRPQEYVTNLVKQSITVYRVDFKAKIILPTGEKKIVLIEIQKAKYTTDLMRFRKYLGSQYADTGNSELTEGRTVPIPIICIYFLGYNIANIRQTPIIKVNRKIIDNYTKQEIIVRDEFIESLTHDSVIIQIPELKKTHRSELEKALSIFEAGKVHEVSINENDYPQKYHEIIRRLLKALAEPTVRQTMDVEDEILDDLENKERLIERQTKIIDEAQKREAEAQKREAEAQKREEEERGQNLAMIKNLYKSGMSIEQISKISGRPFEEIEQLLKN
jgi:hypothetical protein